MLIRRASTQIDIVNIIKMLKEYHSTSKQFKDIPFDDNTVRELCTFCILDKNSVGLVCYDDKDELRGVLLGSIEPVFFNKKVKYGTDLLFVASHGGAYLLKRFIRWARAKGASRIVMGISTEDWRAEELYSMIGMKRVGGMYVIH